MEISVNEWRIDQAGQNMLRLIICGDKKSGKSTLVNCLSGEFHDILNDRSTTQVENSGPKFEQNFTSNTDYRFFSTSKHKFIVADISEHEQPIHNMIAVTFATDTIMIVVDASRGIQIQARHYAWLASLMGIRHIVLAINKMDQVGFDTRIFQAIEQDFIKLNNSLNFASITAIPLSILENINILTQSTCTPWYNGPTLIGHLETIEATKTADNRFVFSVESISHSNDGFCNCSGTVVNGNIITGHSVRITASGQIAQVKRIYTPDEDLPKARTDDVVTLVLDKEGSAAHGDIITTADSPLEITDQFTATIIWTCADPGLASRNYELRMINQQVNASITTIKYRINVSTGTHEPCRQLELNDIAVCNLALNQPVAFDTYATSPALGSFILIDQFNQTTVATGLIMHNLRRAQNVHRQALSITRQDRERLNCHQGKVIWFTGLSGSGKSTIANALEKELHAQGKRTYILDGDNIRQGLNKDLGFTDADRVENIRRVAEVAKLMMDAGLIVMTAFISPFRAEREMARQLIGEENFVEVFVDTPLEVCEQRDPKGLYKKARSGLIPNMTGINSPYEPPARPELVINTVHLTMKVALTKIFCYLTA